jgi:hypothetical protein
MVSTRGVFYLPSVDFNGFSYFSCLNRNTQQSAGTLSPRNISDISRQFARLNYQEIFLNSEYYTRRLVADLSPRRSEFNPREPHERFVLGKVGLGLVFLLVLWFYITPKLHI